MSTTSLPLPTKPRIPATCMTPPIHTEFLQSDTELTSASIGGLKSALHNSNVSEEAKKHDREILKNEFHVSAAEAENKDPSHV